MGGWLPSPSRDLWKILCEKRVNKIYQSEKKKKKKKKKKKDDQITTLCTLWTTPSVTIVRYSYAHVRNRLRMLMVPKSEAEILNFLKLP